MTKSKVREVNGYRLVYEPSNPSSMKSDNWIGYIYEHILVVEGFLGRQLYENEVVHHLDLDRQNNRAANLLVIDRGQHSKLHKWLESGAPMTKVVGANGVNSGKSNEVRTKFCLKCDATLQGKQKKYCSSTCYEGSNRKVERPSKQVLAEELKNFSMLALGRKYGVSDNAVRKWAKTYELL